MPCKHNELREEGGGGSGGVEQLFIFILHTCRHIKVVNSFEKIELQRQVAAYVPEWVDVKFTFKTHFMSENVRVPPLNGQEAVICRCHNLL